MSQLIAYAGEVSDEARPCSPETDVKMASADPPPVFKTPEVVRRTCESPAVFLSRPQFELHEVASQLFTGDNPMMRKAFCSAAPASKKSLARSSLANTRAAKSSRTSNLEYVPSWSAVKPKENVQIGDESRLEQDFVDVQLLAVGEFGVVYRARHRIDGCVYAIKRSKKPITLDRECLKEVQAHALIDNHPNVVRYYSSWCEDGYVYLQTELCGGGSLRAALNDVQERALNSPLLRRHRVGTRGGFNEAIVLDVGRDMVQALMHVHRMNFAHLDMKPDNVFLDSEFDCCGNGIFPSVSPTSLMSLDSPNSVSSTSSVCSQSITYKLGDFGRALPLNEECMEEGDCRYTSLEAVEGKATDYSKVDIYALGMMMYELATGDPLPGTGEGWRALRTTGLPNVPDFSRGFNNFIQTLTNASPDKRPSAEEALGALMRLKQSQQLATSFNTPPNNNCKSKS